MPPVTVMLRAVARVSFSSLASSTQHIDASGALSIRSAYELTDPEYPKTRAYAVPAVAKQ